MTSRVRSSSLIPPPSFPHIRRFSFLTAESLRHGLVFTLTEWPGVVSVFSNQRNKKHSTWSWEFLGMEKDGQIPENSIWKRAQFGRDVIIANLDSGSSPCLG